MKRKTLILILVLEAVILAGLAVLTMLVPNLFSSVLAFPMEQIAAGLGALSGTGAVGNGAAMALLFALSAIPVLVALFAYPRGKDTLAERIALAVLTPMLAISFFGMINPALLAPGPANSEGYARVLRGFLALTLWTVVILFIVLRLIRLFRAGSRPQLMKYLRIVLCVLSMYLMAEAVIALVVSIMTPVSIAPTAADTVVNVFRLTAVIVPLLFDILVVLRVLSLLEISSTEDQEGIGDAASRLSGISCLTLAVTTGLCALQHVVQLVLLPHVTDANASVDIPMVSIAFVVVILLFSRLLVENKQLRDDNSMFI